MDFIFDGPEGVERKLILAHGAGAAMDSPFMNTVATGIAAAGIRVVRFEFPYMVKRRLEGKKSPPNRQPILEQSWLEAVEAVGGSEGLVIGGKSMGGRIASLIADGAGVAGLLCMGYPFHPPGKPERLRTAHLQNLNTPALFLQGTRDPFGTPEEVPGYGISPQIKMHWLEDGDHSLKPRKKSGRSETQNLDEAVAAAIAFIKALA